MKEAKSKGTTSIREWKFIEQILSSVENWLKENELTKANILKGKLKMLEEICRPLTYPLFFALPTLE